MSWTPTPVQKFVTIRPGMSFPRMRDSEHQNVLLFFFFFFFFWGGGGFLQLATAKGRGRILMQNMPKHAVPLKGVPFWGCGHKT